MQIKRKFKSLISSDKNIRDGIPVFTGTRVPVYTVLEHIALGWTFKDLQEAFPAVKSDSLTKLIKEYSKEFKPK